MTARPGPFNLITDVGGLKVGSAHDAGAMTGVTVIRPDARAVAAVAVAGGGPGTRETDALAPDMLVDAIDALVFSGGSVYGLAAADGVVAALGAAGQGFALVPNSAVPRSPVVPAAILYDLANAGNKAWGEAPPYRALGMSALKSVGPHFALGRAGAGYGARAGSAPGGLGSGALVVEAQLGCRHDRAELDPFGLGPLARAVAAGATPMRPVEVMPWGQTIAYVADTNGFLVELCTPVGG